MYVRIYIYTLLSHAYNTILIYIYMWIFLGSFLLQYCTFSQEDRCYYGQVDINASIAWALLIIG
jgi:hypothetical protein